MQAYAPNDTRLFPSPPSKHTPIRFRAATSKGEFEEFRNVAVLDEHDLKDKDGKVVIRLTKDRLQTICDNMNRRVQETGDDCPIVIGHTEDEAPELTQPEIVGFARNFVVSKLLRTKRYALKALFRFYRDKLELIRKFPRRSVELWLNRWEIDPISLLGATTPDRYLGLIKFSRSGEKTYSPIMEGNPTMPNPVMPAETDTDAGLVAKVIAALKETDVWKMLESMAAQSQTQEQPPGDEDPNAVEPENPEDMESGNPEPPMNDQNPEEEPPETQEDEQPVRQSATAAGMNTALPTAQIRKSRPKNVVTLDQLATQLRTAEHQRRVAEKNLTVTVVKLKRESRGRVFMELENEGLVFDINEELESVEPLDDERFEKYVDKMRRRYARTPTGKIQTSAVAFSRPATGPERSKEEATAVAQYALDKGITYAAALTEMNGEKVF